MQWDERTGWTNMEGREGFKHKEKGCAQNSW